MNALTESSKAESQVRQWLIEGQKPADITEALAEQYPAADAAALIGRAVDGFATTATCDRDVLLGWAFEAMREIYRRTLESGDNAGAMKAIKELVTLREKAAHVQADEPEAAAEADPANIPRI